MGVITIEFADQVDDDPCPCCGALMTRLTRFVYSDGDAHAVYYAVFTNNHPDRTVQAIISLGDWGEGSSPEDRAAFALRIRARESQYQMMVTDAAKSPWHDADFLGRMLSRKAALKHRGLKEVFHIADHIVTEDPPIRDYLDGNDPASS